MKNSKLAMGAILLASVMALAMPLAADAAHFGGGGGGHFGGGGGGHFGGGGMHFGGGGGGMHFGGGHFGGGGMHFGGMRFGGGHFGGLRFGGHGVRLGGFHSGGFSRHAFHSGGRGFQARRSFANLHGLSRSRAPFASRVAPRFSRQAFAHQGFGRTGFGRGFHRFAGGFGWFGPLFWPYAYSDIYCDIFWGYWGYGCADPYWSYGYGDPFWAYGYDDIYGGIFSPYGYNELAGYAPSGRKARRRARAEASLSSDQSLAQATPGQITQMCGDDTKEVAGLPIDRMRQLISPNGQQLLALDDLADASTKAAQIIKAACPTSAALTPTGRLAAMQQRIEAMMQAVDVVRGPLDTFSNSLSDEQKAKLNATSQTSAQSSARTRGSVTQSCATANTATQWPGQQIENAVRPNETQQARLRALEDAAAKSQEQLAASCPSELPTTPSARLAAVAKRLDAMLQAVKSVRVALDDFYGTLNDEQKAQFNVIGRQRTAQHQG